MSRRFLETFLLILLLSTLSACAARVSPPGRDWETFLFDAGRSNTTADAVEFPLERAWQRSLSPFEPLRLYPEVQASSPAASGGALFLGSTDGTFHAFDLATGRSLWKFKAGEPVESSPTVSEGFVLFGTSSGVVRCLDRDTGKEAWRFETRSEVASSPLVAGGRVLVYSSDDRVHALTLASGERLWSYARAGFRAVQPRISSSPAASPDAELAYQVFSDGYIVALRIDTGRVVWEKKLSDELHPYSRKTPLVYGDSVFVIDGSRKILELHAATGELKRAYEFLEATDFVVDEATIIAAGDGTVSSFDRTGGSVLWKSTVKGSVRGVFASSGHVFVISSYKKVPLDIEYFEREKGSVTALSRDDGSSLWERDLDSTVTSAPSTSGGRVVLFADNGRVMVFTRGK